MVKGPVLAVAALLAGTAFVAAIRRLRLFPSDYTLLRDFRKIPRPAGDG